MAKISGAHWPHESNSRFSAYNRFSGHRRSHGRLKNNVLTGQPLHSMENVMLKKALWLLVSLVVSFGLLSTVSAEDYTVFGPKDLEKANFIEKWMITNVKSPVGDFRDWDAITSWAASIAITLKEIKPTLT